MDKLANQFFTSPESFGKGMALLMKYNAMQPCDWNTMESFLEELDEAEDVFLDRALSYSAAQLLENKSIIEENDLLKKIIKLLHNKVLDNSLYVAESLVSPQKREPLGDGITADMYRANKKATHPDSYWAGVYDAEKAHGIGGGMNEQILKLAIEAGYEDGVRWCRDDLDVELFAHLIVKNCVVEVMDALHHNHSIRLQLYNHFGVDDE